MPLVPDLLARLAAGGDEAARAGMDLGRLLQGGGVPGPDGGRALADSERLAAVDGLIRHVYATPRPEPTVVWALGVSGDPRASAPLTALLERAQDDPGATEVALQAVAGLAYTRGPGSREALTRAAQEGLPDVSAAARRELAAS